MGKHSAPKRGVVADAKDLLLALTSRPAGRYSARRDEPVRRAASATGLLRSVNRRPVLSAIAVPVAASAALVTSAGVITSQTEQKPQSEAISRPAPAAAETVSDAARKAQGTAQKKDAPAGVELSGPGDDAAGAAGPASTNISGAPCPVSSSIESGLQPNAITAYRAVCAEFPEVKSYGGRRNDPGSDHHTGDAIDIMIKGSTGDRISAYLIKNASRLHVKYIIWEQRIWMPGRGWKGMSNRGGATANHFDHVHLSLNR